MTLKELFNKVEAYNDVAELMGASKAKIKFEEEMSVCCSYGDKFDSYSELRKFIRREYIKETADAIIKCDSWEFDKEVFIDTQDKHLSGTFSVELVSAR